MATSTMDSHVTCIIKNSCPLLRALPVAYVHSREAYDNVVYHGSATPYIVLLYSWGEKKL